MNEKDLLQTLTTRFQPAAVVLYGSGARGALTPTSDIDVVCFVDRDERYPELGRWDGYLLDVWVHPLADANETENFLKLHDGRVLSDRNGIAEDLLRRVRAFVANAPARLDEKHMSHLRHWLWKMFDRASRGDLEGSYRRHWLLHDLPQVWCELTGRHFLGFANALAAMKNDAALHHAIERALQDDASLTDIRDAVEKVAGPRPPSL